MRLLNDRIAIDRDEAPTTASGGSIILPDVSKEKPASGKVIAVGPGKLTPKGVRVPIEVKVGDQVLFSSYAGGLVTIEGKEVWIMTEDDVIAVTE